MPSRSGTEPDQTRLAEAWRGLGLTVAVEDVPRASSPRAVALTAGAVRVLAAAAVVTAPRGVALACAAVSLLFSLPGPPLARSRLVSRLPFMGATTQVSSVPVPGSAPQQGPGLVVVAAENRRRPTMWTGTAAAALLGVSAVVGSDAWRLAAAAVVVVELVWLLAASGRWRPAPTGAPDVLTALARRLVSARPVRDVWLVGGSGGLGGFLRARPEAARTYWLVAVRDSQAGLSATPERARVPPRGTHPPPLRAVAQAAIESGEAIDVSRPAHGSSEARTGLLAGMPSVTLHTPPRDTERAAEVLAELARTIL